MALVLNINFSLFCDAFVKHDRKDAFSYEGKKALFQYLEDLSEGENIELDVVALCCDYCEEDSETIAEQYSIDLSAYDDEEDKEEVIADFLNNNSLLVGKTSSGFVYAVF